MEKKLCLMVKIIKNFFIYQIYMNIFDIKYLLLLYLVQMTSLTNNTLGKQLKEYVYSSREMQHIINITFLMVLISILDDSRTFNNLVLTSLIIYIFYLFSTKLDLQYNLILLGIIISYYFYKKSLDGKILRIQKDNDIDFDLKQKIISKDLNIEKLIEFGLAGVLVYFVYVYFSRKNVQYGGGFNYSKFLFY